jgi:hypothetical protein
VRRFGSALRDWFSHRSTIAAVVLVVAGLLFLTLEVQSPNWVYFRGERVTGTVQGGIVYYDVKGSHYTQDYPEVSTPPDGSKVSVYFYPDSPSSALVDRPTRWIEATVVLVWFAAAAILMVVAAFRRRAVRHRNGGR